MQDPVTLEPVRRTRGRRSRARVALWVLGAVVAAGALAAGAALLWWPGPRVEADAEALARVVEPGYAGRYGRGSRFGSARSSPSR